MKLVRDRIPKLYPQHTYRCPDSGAEHALLLRLKAAEELGEVLSAPTREDRVSELADLYEVLDAMRAQEGITDEELAEARTVKNRARGAFGEGWVLV